MDQLIPTQLNLHCSHRDEILSWVTQKAPMEACGIIAGETLTSRKVFPIDNTLQSPTAFLMDAAQMLQAFMEIEDHHWEVLAFFHSHPHSWPSPSPTDLDQNYYPDTPHLIAGKHNGAWVLRAYLLSEGESREIPIVILPILL